MRRVLHNLAKNGIEAAGKSVPELLLVATTAKRHTFVFSHDGWRDTMLTPSILVLLAIGQMVVIVTRNVDLSVGAVLGLTADTTGKIFIAGRNFRGRILGEA